MKNIFVFGSVNMDLVVAAERMPKIGESVKGHGFMTNQGGKGANQAVACKKLGGEKVVFLGAVGNDVFGERLKFALSEYGVDVSNVYVDEKNQSGVCFIMLDEGEKDNYLIIDGGANDAVRFECFERYLERNALEGDLFITQLEVNVEAVKSALRFAKNKGMYTVLNPSPYSEIGKEFLENVDLLVLNETETELMTGINPKTDEELVAASKFLIGEGVKEVVITLGENGSAYYKDELIKELARKVVVVDATSAGDTFLGALAFQKAQGKEIKDALSFASLCASVTVSRKGASISIPTKSEIESLT